MEKNTIKTCKTCLNFECCKRDGFPVVATEREIRKIEDRTGLQRENFVVEKKYNNGKRLYFLQYTQKGHCIFFDQYSSTYKKCKIYSFRPMDCRLFPLDVDLQNGDLILIKYNICKGSDFPLDYLVKTAKTRILPFLTSDLQEYADLRTELYEKGCWEKIEVLGKTGDLCT
jgi:Fe-S-cluster containining protein